VKSSRSALDPPSTKTPHKYTSAAKRPSPRPLSPPSRPWYPPEMAPHRKAHKQIQGPEEVLKAFSAEFVRTRRPANTIAAYASDVRLFARAYRAGGGTRFPGGVRPGSSSASSWGSRGRSSSSPAAGSTPASSLSLRPAATSSSWRAR
jgi:hypothetical protein